MGVTSFGAMTLSLDRCPHCSVANPLLSVIGEHETVSSAGRRFKWRQYVCSRCGMVVLGGSPYEDPYVRMIFPEPERVQEGLPAKAGTFLKQAMESIHAPSGAIMLCASSVDAMLKEKGLVDGKLYTRIEEASAKGLITQEMTAWAHEVRLDANDERHADDEAGMPTSEDARKCIDFVKALGEFMFVLPARVERGREASKRKK